MAIWHRPEHQGIGYRVRAGESGVLRNIGSAYLQPPAQSALLTIAKSKWLWDKNYKHPNTNPVVTMEMPEGSLYVLDGYHRVV
jgi:hypothetical protein